VGWYAQQDLESSAPADHPGDGLVVFGGLIFLPSEDPPDLTSSAEQQP
jgi:hypothetical protein